MVIDIDAECHEAVLRVHWIGGRYTEVRMARRQTGRYPPDRRPDAATVLHKLGGQWPDRELAVSMSRMRCKTPDGETWTTVRVQQLRDHLGIPGYDPGPDAPKLISADAASKRLGICVGSVHKLIASGALPATQLMHSAPWQIPVDALDSEPVRIGLQRIAERRPKQALEAIENMSLLLPGF